MAEDFYNTLGVGRDAEAADIKAAYRKLARKYHPDRNPGDTEAEDRFKAAAEAYRVLGDSDLRGQYDAYLDGRGTSAGPPGAGETAEDVFDEIFGSRPSSRVRQPGARSARGRADGRAARAASPPPRARSERRPMPERGADLRYHLDVDIEDIAYGVEKTIYVPRNTACRYCGGTGAERGSAPVLCQTCRGTGSVRVQQGFFEQTQRCPECAGSGRKNPLDCRGCEGTGVVEEDAPVTVEVPAGVASGARLKLRGEGQVGEHGAPPGDLYVVVDVLDHPLFEREEEDLVTEVPISFSQAALGAQVEVPTLEGKVRMRIPAGSQSGRMFRLKGKGLPSVDGHHRGDQRVRIIVQTPTHLEGHARELFEELAELEAERPLSDAIEDYRRRIREYFG